MKTVIKCISKNVKNLFWCSFGIDVKTLFALSRSPLITRVLYSIKLSSKVYPITLEKMIFGIYEIFKRKMNMLTHEDEEISDLQKFFQPKYPLALCTEEKENCCFLKTEQELT